eukprot:CAMPEP_0170557070 /NCGR_PEP_ID=MMETSP0211-20121228/19175_1 /TAXON_ID=311385 /ORGANISM="Pseudokeronopsis sp., Strain OXSARD2" /LENGTH=133 /DNA_ID=CAMNT_0010867773 /DNA_START=152 /DNA_END=551 /DNA_ORIENTATION=-
MINEVDVDGNGTVEFAEFVILMTNKVKEMTRDEEIKEAFKVLDKEHDDFISVKELKYFMRKVAHIKLSSEEAKAMIEYADTNEDGLVTFDDFLKVVNMTRMEMTRTKMRMEMKEVETTPNKVKNQKKMNESPK